MAKIRKVKRRKKYQYNVNRKRMNKKRLPSMECKTVKNAWDRQMSAQKNFKKMGLVFDVNKTVKRPSETVVEIKNINEFNNHDPNTESVVEELRENAKKAKIKTFRLPVGTVKYLTYLMDKYGDDYKAMSRDKNNYLQQTWKQIRSKINTFKRIPEQYNEYLKSKESSNDVES